MKRSITAEKEVFDKLKKLAKKKGIFQGVLLKMLIEEYERRNEDEKSID